MPKKVNKKSERRSRQTERQRKRQHRSAVQEDQQAITSHVPRPVIPTTQKPAATTQHTKRGQSSKAQIDEQPGTICTAGPSVHETNATTKQPKKSTDLYCHPYPSGYRIPKCNKECPEFRENKNLDGQMSKCSQVHRNEYMKTLMAKKRENPEFRTSEKLSQIAYKKRKRNEQEYRDSEKQHETAERKRKRLDEEYRDSEKQRETADRKRKRLDEEYRDSEKQRETADRKRKRLDEEYREVEKVRETADRKNKRKSNEYKVTEKSRESCCRKQKRLCSERKNQEAQVRSRYLSNKKQKSVEELIEKFHRTVTQGPVYICTCCNQLFYKHSVSPFSDDIVKNNTIREQIPKIVSVSDNCWICRTCKSYVRKGKIPPMSVLNKMTFPEQGILKDLNPLEQNLLAVRIPFMKIHEAARGKQQEHRIAGQYTPEGIAV